jgi:hypothetical protein
MFSARYGAAMASGEHSKEQFHFNVKFLHFDDGVVPEKPSRI